MGIKKLFGINALVFCGLISLVEICFSRYFFYLPASDIPWSHVDFKISYDTSNLIESEGGAIIYSRDKNGYRPYRKSANYILSVGGSTTAQTFVDDNKTFQRVLESMIPQGVINGGVDGQSSYGHLHSIERWHSKSLDNQSITHVFFLVGVNDTRLIEGKSELQIRHENTTFLVKIRQYLGNRSFLYRSLRSISHQWRYRGGQGLGIGVFAHGKKLEISASISEDDYVAVNADRSKQYEVIFRKLLWSTRRAFPKSMIVVIQQQVPACRFTFDGRLLVRQLNFKRFCQDLATVYNSQNYVVSNLADRNIRVDEMYKASPLRDIHFYDAVHTNSSGSREIAKYIFARMRSFDAQSSSL